MACDELDATRTPAAAAVPSPPLPPRDLVAAGGELGDWGLADRMARVPTSKSFWAEPSLDRVPATIGVRLENLILLGILHGSMQSAEKTAIEDYMEETR